MSTDFINAFESEWLKKKRSLGSWLVVIGAFFTPAIVIAARLMSHDKLHKLYSADGFWMLLWRNCWESMAIFFLPMISILTTSLMTQIEYGNNAWKQAHALPLSPAVIFSVKFMVIVLMVAQFFVLFNVGIYLSAIIPYLLVPGTPYPNGPMPFLHFLVENLWYFADCLPIIAAQYLLSLRFNNFLAPIGFGFLIWVGTLAALSWKFGYIVPYSYTMLDYLKDDSTGRAIPVPAFDLHWMALGYFALFIATGYGLFSAKTQKG